MKTEDFKELKSFLAGYFHEDWDLEVSEPDDVIFNYINSGVGGEVIKAVVSQIEKYVNQSADDADAERGLLMQLGCYYLPSADGLETRSWLAHVANKLSD
jgi:CdiI immunity protein